MRIEIIQEPEESTERRWTDELGWIDWTTRLPLIGRCECGEEVELGHFTCPCECGRDYGPSGDLLAPRSQWGEETGETLADIMGPQASSEEYAL